MRDYGDETLRFVRADEGDIRVAAGKTERRVRAGESVTIDRSGAIADGDADVVGRELSWTDDRLILRNVTAAEAVARLWRWYGLDVTLTDSVAGARSLSIDVPLGASQAALAAIEGGAQVRFQWVDGKMTLQPVRARR